MSTKISEEGGKKYSSVLRKFDKFFDVRRNVILERAKFNRKSQLAGESSDQYIATLYRLVETCEYPADLKDELLRDRLVVGMRDSAFSERLQLDTELTLEKTKKAMRQKEAVKEQNQMLQDGNRSANGSMDTLKAQRQRKGVGMIVVKITVGGHIGPSLGGRVMRSQSALVVGKRPTTLETGVLPPQLSATNAIRRATFKLSAFLKPQLTLMSSLQIL